MDQMQREILNDVLKETLTQAEFQFIEQKLREYPDNKAMVEEWEETKRNYITQSSGSEPGMPGGSNVSNPTHNKTIHMLSIERKIEIEQLYVKAINAVLPTLSNEDYQLIKLKYFEKRLTNEGVALELKMSLSTYKRKRRELLWRFANRFGLV